jgi:hypothetical protein
MDAELLACPQGMNEGVGCEVVQGSPQFRNSPSQCTKLPAAFEKVYGMNPVFLTGSYGIFKGKGGSICSTFTLPITNTALSVAK